MANQDEVIKVDLSKPKSTEEEVYKVDLTKPVQDEAEERDVDESGVVNGNEDTTTNEEQEEVQPQGEVQEEQPVLEEVTEEPEKIEEEQVSLDEEIDAKVDLSKPEVVDNKSLPESVEKLIKFMEDTGGDLHDYVRLNTDISKLDTSDILDEYYKQTKSHLSSDERSFLLEEKFSYDEDTDSDKDIKKKKIALKEEAAKAKKYLESQRDKYYSEIKASSNLTSDQLEAVEFYEKHKEDSKSKASTKEANNKDFLHKTDNLFNSEFKGFEFNVGEKKFRYNVKNTSEVKANQSDLNNFVSKFVDSNSKLNDAAGYHKSLYAAMNPDALAQHFYEQGKADAIKQTVAQSKNINTEARQTHGETQVGGVKYKVLGESSRDFKFKRRNKR